MLQDPTRTQPHEIIRRAKEKGLRHLSESEAKGVLKNYGVPVVEESVVTTEAEAVAEALRIGFPVVLKGLGANLIHKTEQGIVITELRSPDEVCKAFIRIKKLSGRDWEGCLVQPMVQGKREFAAGLFKDPQFGPVVMFGLGGVFAEAIGDVAFRLSPVTKTDATGMMEDLSCRKLLFNFRGEPAVNHEQLIQILTGLCRLSDESPEIMEVDINPLIVQPDGHLIAVDALIAFENAGHEKTQADEKSAAEGAEVIRRAIEVMVSPRSIAVVGAKRPNADLLPGADIFRTLSDFGFSGALYPINPNAGEIRGHKAYPDLFSLPETPDLVIICVPAEFVPKALQDCADSGSKNVHVFASGFKETGTAEGMRLQGEIERIANDGGLRVIGPNCMGLYVPASGIVTWPAASKKNGPVAFVSQSGGHARDFTKFAGTRFGIHFSKVISYGNALTLDCTDFLEYLVEDDETRLILLYLEGVADGRKLFDLVLRSSRTKPVMIFKAGLTEAGLRTAASHTGSLAGSEKIWNAFFRQSGAIRVASLEEMAEASLAFLHLPECGGRRAVVLGSGGGISVNAADACSEERLILPAFPQELVEKFQELIPAAGNIVDNPMDAYRMFFDLRLLGQAIQILSDGSYADMFIISMQLDWLYTDSGGNGKVIEKAAAYIAGKGKELANGKPLVVAWRQYQDNPAVKQVASSMEKTLLNAGVPVYRGFKSAVSALSKLAGYHELITRHQDLPESKTGE